MCDLTSRKARLGLGGMGDSPVCLDGVLVCASESRASRPCHTTHMGESPMPLEPANRGIRVEMK